MVGATRARPRRPPCRARLALGERPGSRARARRRARLVLALTRPPRRGLRQAGGRARELRGQPLVLAHERLPHPARWSPAAATSREGWPSSKRRSRSGASSATGTSSPRPSTPSAGPASTTPATRPGALAAFEQSLELHRELGDPAGVTRALVGVCQVLVALGDVDRAEPLSRDLLERADGDPRTEHFAYHFLADCALIRGDTVEAEKRYRQSLEAALPLGDVIETSFEVQGVAMAVAGSDPERALRLAASVEALWESLGIVVLARVLGRAPRALHRPRARAAGRRSRCRVGRRPGAWRSTTRSSSLSRRHPARAARQASRGASPRARP